MPEYLLVHDPARIDRDTAISRATSLGIGQVVHGLAPWMVDQGLDYGPDGYLAVVTCGVPEHAARREVLATFKGAAIRTSVFAMVLDHIPPPPDTRKAELVSLAALANMTSAQDARFRQLVAQLLAGDR